MLWHSANESYLFILEWLYCLRYNWRFMTGQQNCPIHCLCWHRKPFVKSHFYFLPHFSSRKERKSLLLNISEINKDGTLLNCLQYGKTGCDRGIWKVEWNTWRSGQSYMGKSDVWWVSKERCSTQILNSEWKSPDSLMSKTTLNECGTYTKKVARWCLPKKKLRWNKEKKMNAI